MLITGSIMPLLYYGFYCSVSTQISYMLITCALCLAAVTVSMSEKFSSNNYRHVRALVFYSFGIFGFVPLVHWYYEHMDVIEQMTDSIFRAFRFLALMGILYTIGVIFYALRIPERFYPGKFDVLVSVYLSTNVFTILTTVCPSSSTLTNCFTCLCLLRPWLTCKASRTWWTSVSSTSSPKRCAVSRWQSDQLC